ncbi:MAG: DUF2848 family protein [Actinobacteria bacterium]|nr:DUF2848 family protein [Actinomycetota bacterium]
MPAAQSCTFRHVHAKPNLLPLDAQHAFAASLMPLPGQSATASSGEPGRIGTHRASDIADHPGDSMRIESIVDGVLYQQGTLSSLRAPADLLAKMTRTLGDIEGDLVVFMGTLPLLHGSFVYGRHWQCSLTLSAGKTQTHRYETKWRNASCALAVNI